VDDALKKTLIAGIPALLIALGASIALSIWQMPGGVLLEATRGAWISNDVIVRLIDVLIPLTVTVLAVVFSLLLDPAGLPGGAGAQGSFFRLTRRVLVLVIVSTVLYAGILGILRPIAHTARERALSDSRIARELAEQGENAAAAGDYQEALRAYRSYLVLDPGNEEIRAALTEAERGAETPSPGGATGEEQDFTPIQATQERGVGELISLAEQYLAEEDYFSAHRYASLALELDADSPRARRIAARARSEIRDPGLSESETAEREVFLRKRDGYLALYDEDNPIRAYYIFRRLREDRPGDEEVRQYFAEALEQVQQVSFFMEDARENVDLPGRHNAILHFQDDAGRDVHLWADKIVMATTGTYLYGIEVMALSGERVDYHLAARYGKLVERVLNMRGISREAEQPRELPRYYQGSRSPQEETLLQLPFSTETILTAGYADAGMENAGVLQLFAMRDFYPAIGHRVEPVHRELLERLSQPFAFVILAIFAIALGWRWRNQSLSRPSVLVFAAAPLVFLPALWLSDLYRYLHEALATLLVARMDMLAATVLFVAAETLLLILALAVFAGQKTR